MATITKADFVRIIAENLNTTQTKAKLLADNLFEAMAEAIIQGNKIEIRGLGSWTVKETKARPAARNPKTGEIVYVPDRRKVSFKPGKALRKSLSKPRDAQSPSILLIDDDEQVRTPLRKMLEMNRYGVEEASNGREGIEKYHKKPADVVIVDIFMPEKSGLEVIQELKKDSSVKIIAISAVDIRDGLDLASLTRNYDVTTIEKPLRMRELLDAVKGLLEEE